MVLNYMSFPTNTLYLVEEMLEIPSPAITICPKKSISSSQMIALNLNESNFSTFQVVLDDGASMLNMTRAQFFDSVRLQLPQLLLTTFYWDDLGTLPR